MVLVFMVFYILSVVGNSRRIGNLVLGIRNVDAFHLGLNDLVQGSSTFLALLPRDQHFLDEKNH